MSLASALILLLIGFLQWKWLQGSVKLIFWVVVASVTADVVSLLLMNNRINTWPVINLFFLIQFGLLFQILGANGNTSFIQIILWGCIAFGLFDLFFFEGPKTFNSYSSYATGILMIISALTYLYKLLSEMPVEKVHTLPLFWLAFGVLVYYGGNLFLFLFNNYLITHLPQNHQSIWELHNVLNISKNVFFFVTLWINYRSRTSQI